MTQKKSAAINVKVVSSKTSKQKNEQTGNLNKGAFLMSETYYEAINWNEIEDIIDKSTWEKLTEQFWLDTRIPLSNDLDDWRTLSQLEKDTVGHVFGGLTLLDTVQSESGMDQLRKDVRTPHEEAVLNNIQFMESVHAKVILPFLVH